MAVGGVLWLIPAVTTSCAQGTVGSGRVAPERVSPDVRSLAPPTVEQSEELFRRKQARQERIADEAQKQLEKREDIHGWRTKSIPRVVDP